MDIYFKEKAPYQDAFTGPNSEPTQLILTSVNYARPDSEFYVHLEDDQIDSMMGYQIIETLINLQVLKQDKVAGYLVADRMLPLYRKELDS